MISLPPAFFAEWQAYDITVAGSSCAAALASRRGGLPNAYTPLSHPILSSGHSSVSKPESVRAYERAIRHIETIFTLRGSADALLLSSPPTAPLGPTSCLLSVYSVPHNDLRMASVLASATAQLHVSSGMVKAPLREGLPSEVYSASTLLLSD